MGKVCLVTRCSTGIGLATAQCLAAVGATIVFGCRSEERAREAMKTILKAWRGQPSKSHVAPTTLPFTFLYLSPSQSNSSLFPFSRRCQRSLVCVSSVRRSWMAQVKTTTSSQMESSFKNETWVRPARLVPAVASRLLITKPNQTFRLASIGLFSVPVALVLGSSAFQHHQRMCGVMMGCFFW